MTARRPVEIALATYNTMNLFDTRHPTAPKRRRELRALAHTVDGMRPDILALQEVGSVTALREFNAALKDPFPHLGLVPGNSDRHIHLAFMSRMAFRMTSHAGRVLADEQGNALEEFHTEADHRAQAPSALRFQRDLLLGEFVSGSGVRLAVFNAHLKSRGASGWHRHSTEAIRLAESREAARIVAGYRARHPRTPVAVVGDFNEGLEHPSLEPLASAPGLSDPVGDELSAARQRLTTFWSRPAERIDQVLLCDVARIAYVPGSAGIVTHAAARKASDHLPVMVRLRF